jgi:tetratricopeptide (TPR) repeat protein
LPKLPSEPEDELTGTRPNLKSAGRSSQGRQAVLPEPPDFRSADFRQLPAPYTGRFGEIMDLLGRGKNERARTDAEAWRTAEPGQTLALVALGEACRVTGDLRRAARAFGSVIDLFPARADLRRFAAGRLASLREPSALDLAIDSAWRAVEQRPDHPSGHHLLATFLMEAGRFEQAFAVLTAALEREFAPRYPRADQILGEDAALVALAWTAADPARADELRRRLRRLDVLLENGPSLRFVLTWESDANDVDFHVRDGLGYHAFYAKPTLPTGGELYADVRDGYGPECFTVRVPTATRAYPYRLSVRYASRGPMGYGMGTLQIIEHDGHGKLRFDHRPFLIMNAGGYLELPEVKAP